MLSYRVAGAGPPLLLIHGWGVTFNVWQNLAPRLGRHFQLIMIELPGLGNSPRPDPARPYYVVCADAIDALRQALGLEQWAVLSYSSGTRAAEAYLQRYPARVSRAAFLCPAYAAGPRGLALKTVLGLDRRWPAFGDWVVSGWRVNQLILWLAFNGRWQPYTGDWQREIGGQRPDSLKLTLSAMPQSAGAPFQLPPVPSLFAWARQDVLVSGPRRLGPGDCWVPGNHSAPLTEAEAVAEAVLPFLGA